MSAFTDLLRRNVDLSDAEADLLEQHYSLLDKWNRKLNLTAIRSMAESVVRHYAESVFLAQRLPRAASAVDVGSGGGFPGIPVAILHPSIRMTLVESHQRKAVFLAEAARNLRSDSFVPQIHVVGSRIEEVHDSFDLLTARAINWESFWPLVPRLAGQVALLLGSDDTTQILREKNFEWNLPEKLPWGDNRYLVKGRLKPRSTWNSQTDVPRET